MFLPVIFLIIVGGIVGEEINECDSDTISEECMKISNSGNDYLLLNAPDKEELRKNCSNELEYFKCYIEKSEKCGLENAFETFTKNAYSITKDICNENSELHKDYIASIECYKTLEDDPEICYSKALDIYNISKLLGQEEHELLDDAWTSKEARCMIDSLYVACLSEKVLKSCGKVAYLTVSEILSRSQYMNTFCPKNERDKMLTSLLSELELEDEMKDIYKEVFAVIKK